MGANSAISWTHHTFNPWWGCVEVSPACDHCYARSFATRTGHEVWGKDAPRRFFGDAHWREPLTWNQWAKDGICYQCGGKKHRAGADRCPVCEGRGEIDPYRARVFSASMADVLELRPDLVAERARLWALAESTEYLDWLFLTKRPWNFRAMVPAAWLSPKGWPAHVWPGTTIENRQQLRLRAAALCAVPSLQKFISMEPLLEDVGTDPLFEAVLAKGGITWVIGGGESGGKARPSHPDWHRAIRDLCQRFGIAYHFKQWGEWAPGEAAIATSQRTERTATWFNDEWQFGTLTVTQSKELHVDDEPDVFRFGLKQSHQRVIDGRVWDEVPAPRTWSEAA